MPRPDDFTSDSPEPRKRKREVRPPEQDDDDYEDDDRPRRRDDDDGGVSTLIPYKNARALIAYYCGVFSLIPCFGAILGPTALILGLLGLRYARKYPTAKGTGHAIAGIVLGTLTSLGNIGGIIALVVAGILNK